METKNFNTFDEQKAKLDQLEEAEHKVRQFTRSVDECLHQNPWGAVLLSALAGLSLGVVMSRSSRRKRRTKGFFNG